jgi:DNA invertase Pin-like site-specific DNA recombinase
MQKAFGYLRVSGKGQVDGDGFPRQLQAIKNYAATHGLKLVRIFREKGVSGEIESGERPAFAEMMTALYSNGVHTIIIERLNRLARDLMVQERIIADLQAHDFTLISVAEPDLMAKDPERVFFRQMMGAVAQLDKSNTVAKLRGARMRKRAKEGRCEGAKPYGFYEGETVVLEHMKALRASDLGFDRIAARLNADGFKPRMGERWHGLVVNRILTGKGRATRDEQHV